MKEQLLKFLTNQQNILFWIRAASSVHDYDKDNLMQEGAGALHICAFYGLKKVILDLDPAKYKIDELDPFFHKTPLIHACCEGYADTAIALIRKGALANIEDDDGNTALTAAVLTRQVSVVKELLQCSEPGVRPDPQVNQTAPAENDQSVLVLAISRFGRDVGTLKEFDSPEYGERRHELEQQLKYDIQLVGLLAHEPRVHIDQVDSQGWSALMRAAMPMSLGYC